MAPKLFANCCGLFASRTPVKDTPQARNQTGNATGGNSPSTEESHHRQYRDLSQPPLIYITGRRRSSSLPAAVREQFKSSSRASHDIPVISQAAKEEAARICEGIKGRTREVMNFKRMETCGINENLLKMLSPSNIEELKDQINFDARKSKYQGKKVSQYIEAKRYPSKQKDLRPAIIDIDNYCAHGTTLSSVVAALCHTNKQLVPHVKAEKLGVGTRGEASLHAQRYVGVLPVKCTPNSGFVFDMSEAKEYAISAAERKHASDSNLKLPSDEIPVIVLGDGVNRTAPAGISVARNSAYERVNIRNIAVEEQHRELVIGIMNYLGVDDINICTHDELGAANHWPHGTGAQICEDVRNQVDEALSLAHQQARDSSSAILDLRPSKIDMNHVCAHGTNFTSFVSALIHSNKQLVPINEAKARGIDIRTGENRVNFAHSIEPEIFEYISTHGLKDAADIGFNYVRRYARSSSETHGGFLDKPLLVSDEIPVVILGDGTDGVAAAEQTQSGRYVWGEQRYKRLNIRMIALDEFNKSLAIEVLKHLDIDDVRVCTFGELEFAQEGFQALWNKGESIKNDDQA